MHPFMPFLSEELYQRLPKLPGFSAAESIMLAEYPNSGSLPVERDAYLEEIVDDVMEIVASVRKTKAIVKSKGIKPIGKYYLFTWK